MSWRINSDLLGSFDNIQYRMMYSKADPHSSAHEALLPDLFDSFAFSRHGRDASRTSDAGG